MDKSNDLEILLNNKKIELEKFKKAQPKLILISIITCFIIPFIPHRRIADLVQEKGYWGAVLFGTPTFVIVLFIVIYCQYANIKSELTTLETKVNFKNRKQ